MRLDRLARMDRDALLSISISPSLSNVFILGVFLERATEAIRLVELQVFGVVVVSPCWPVVRVFLFEGGHMLKTHNFIFSFCDHIDRAL